MTDLIETFHFGDTNKKKKKKKKTTKKKRTIKNNWDTKNESKQYYGTADSSD